MASGAELIRKIKEQIHEVDPKDVHELQQNGNGAVIVDVREQHEFEQSHVPGAVHVPRGHLESRIEGAVGDRSKRVILYCASGSRSALAAHTLQEHLGYEDVASMRGGITLWKDRGYDVVDRSNLQRQVAHSNDRIGMPKVDSAEISIHEINPDVKVEKHEVRLGPDNIMEIIEGYDVVVDGLDNFPTRYLLNDASVRLQIPVVSASILGFEGQLSVFHPYEGPCYRCLYPTPPPAERALAEDAKHPVSGARRATDVIRSAGRMPAGAITRASWRRSRSPRCSGARLAVRRRCRRPAGMSARSCARSPRRTPPPSRSCSPRTAS